MLTTHQYTLHSDLDISLDISGTFMDEQFFLNRLQQMLRRSGHCESVFFVRHARVPVVKVVDKSTGQAIDFSCQLNTAQRAIDTVHKFREDFPAMPYLVLLLKYILKQRNLNDVSNGGLGSYALSLIVVNHLQMHTSNIDPDEAKKTSLGTLLLDFLALYGIYFNYVTTGIHVGGGGQYYRKKDTRDTLISRSLANGFCVHVADPHDVTNNITRSSHRVDAIRNCFRSCFGRLVRAKSKSRTGSLLGRIIRLDQDIIYRASQLEAVERMCIAESRRDPMMRVGSKRMEKKRREKKHRKELRKEKKMRLE